MQAEIRSPFKLKEFKLAVPAAGKGHLAIGDDTINYSKRGI